MSTQPLSNRIGNAIGECKRRLLDRVKEGANLDDAIAVFIAELRLALQVIAETESGKRVENVSSESMPH